LPVSLFLFLVIAAFLALIVAVISYPFKRLAIHITFSFLMVCVCMGVFNYFMQRGLERAKAYAEVLASEIEAIHKSKGVYPKGLNEIPVEKRPEINVNAKGNYIHMEDDGFYTKIGVFLFLIPMKLIDQNFM